MAAASDIPVFATSFGCTPKSMSMSMSMSVPMPFFSVTHQLCKFRRLSALVSPFQHQRASPSNFIARSMCQSSASESIETAHKERISRSPVVIYSKSWCPYCLRVKGLFDELGVKPTIVELDELDDEVQVQAALQKLTGQSTVPNVFIGGKHIGGCDDTFALHWSGKLISLLKQSGVQIS